MPTDHISAKQAAFVREYLLDLNATKAAIRAGYSARTAQPQASRMMANPRVARAITAGQAARSARTEIKTDHVVMELARIAFGDIRKLFDHEGGLKPAHELDDETAGMLAAMEVDTSTEQSRGGAPPVTTRTTKVRSWDKIRALELLGRHLGMFKEQVEHVGRVSFVIER